VAVGAETEVLDSLTGVLGATEDQGVASGGSAESKLVQGDSLTTGSENTGTGGGGESQGSDGHLGALEQTVVVSDGTDNNDGSLLALLVDVGDNAGQGDGRSVDLGSKQTSKNNLVERGVSSASQEAVKLHQELEVDIVALGGSAVSALNVVAVEIDTCRVKPSSAFLFKHAQKIATLSCAFANKMVHWSQRRRRRSAHLLYSHTEAELQSSRTHGGGCRCEIWRCWVWRWMRRTTLS
jgi:hypothetical protein